MKQTLLHLSVSVFLLFAVESVSAKKYYFSTSGDDSRTSTQAQNSATPWKTISKLNSFFSSLNFGDSVLFKCGQTFYGAIIISKSGSVTKPIVFSSYGTGNKPVISGLTTLGNWVSVGNGVYESYNSLLGTAVNMVTFNGAFQAIGRYPNLTASNKGYLSFESHTANSITDRQLTSSINWTGAEVVVRPKRWILDRRKVTSHAGSTLSFSTGLTYDPYDNYGYFLQNHIKTLDQLGEWYYNPSTKKLGVFFGSGGPSAYNVQASTVGTLVTINNQDNIVFNNLAFNGSNSAAFDLYYADNIIIKFCSFMYSGINSIDGASTTNLTVTNTYFNFTNNNAINLSYNCANSFIRYNYIANTGITPGMGLSGNESYQGITTMGNNNLVEYNALYNTGYAAIRFGSGNSNVIKNNFINYFTLTKDDGGGIYTGATDDNVYTGQTITGNIILNGIGVWEGTDKPGTGSSSGIDLDDNASNIEITGNTVTNCGKSGILIHNSYTITIKNNILYNNLTQLTLAHDFAMPDALLRNNIIKNNILFSKVDSQMLSSVRTEADDIKLLGVMDSNYYCRPTNENLTILSSCVIGGVRTDRYQDLAGWKATYSLDKASHTSPLQIPAYTINSLIGSNKYSNGTFNSNISGLYTSPTSTWISKKLDGGTFQATTPSTSGTYSVIIGVGAINSSKNYVLRFSSQASKDTVISAYLRLSEAPYTYLSDVKLIPLSKSRNENEYLFTLPASASGASIIFESKSPKLTFWLDNISFNEANISITDPDDNLLFAYNVTERSITVPLPGIYVDAYNKLYSFTITVPPYSSVVLIKQTPLNMPISFQNKKIKLEGTKSEFQLLASL